MLLLHLHEYMKSQQKRKWILLAFIWYLNGWYFSNRCLQPLPFGDDVKVRKKSTNRMHASEQRGLLGISYASATLPFEHLNERERTGSIAVTWLSFATIFAEHMNFPSVFSMLSVGFGFDWLQQDSANSFSFVRCESGPHVSAMCVCLCVFVFLPSHLVFRWCYSLLPLPKRFIRFDFSLALVPGNCVSAEETDEIVCRRLVEIDMKEVSVFRQLYAIVGMSMAPFDWKKKFEIVCSTTHYRFNWHHSFFNVPQRHPRSDWISASKKARKRMQFDHLIKTILPIGCRSIKWLDANSTLIHRLRMSIFVIHGNGRVVHKKVCQTYAHRTDVDRFGQLVRIVQLRIKVVVETGTQRHRQLYCLSVVFFTNLIKTRCRTRFRLWSMRVCVC